ncbi:MAG: hypothetical protein ACRDWE_10785, partial [Acidimicrobiales bacterium]
MSPAPAEALANLPVRPTPGEFAALAASGQRIVSVWTDIVGDELTPVGAFSAVVGDGPGFLLESVEGGERWGRYSFVGRAPLATIVARDGIVFSTGALDLSTADPAARGPGATAGILATLERLLAECRAPVVPGLPPLQSGVVGYLAYD